MRAIGPCLCMIALMAVTIDGVGAHPPWGRFPGGPRGGFWGGSWGTRFWRSLGFHSCLLKNLTSGEVLCDDVCPSTEMCTPLSQNNRCPGLDPSIEQHICLPLRCDPNKNDCPTNSTCERINWDYQCVRPASTVPADTTLDCPDVLSKILAANYPYHGQRPGFRPGSGFLGGRPFPRPGFHGGSGFLGGRGFPWYPRVTETPTVFPDVPTNAPVPVQRWPFQRRQSHG